MPKTMLTTMKHVESHSEQAGQEYTVFTNYQQLFKIATQITWYKPGEWKIFFPILGRMHTLMSFIGCIRTLMANTGLSDLLKSAGGGCCKNTFRQKCSIEYKRTMRMCRRNTMVDTAGGIF